MDAPTGAYVVESRKLDARFRVKGFQGIVETNASAPTVQLPTIRVVLDVIAYRWWDFRAMDVSSAFLRSGALKRETCATLPGGVENGNIACKLLNPLYSLSTACKGRRETIRDFLAGDFGGGGGGGWGDYFRV